MSNLSKVYERINWVNNQEPALNDTNLNKVDYAVDAIDNRVISLDTTKFDKADSYDLVANWVIDEETGIITITKVNGTKVVFDLNIEKIPVSFSMSDEGVITMVTDDGTTYTADIGSMIPILTFTDSDTIAVTVSGEGINKTYSFSIKSGSVTENMLQPNYLADIKVEVGKVQTAAAQVESSKTEVATNTATVEADTTATHNDMLSAKNYKELAESASASASASETAVEGYIDDAIKYANQAYQSSQTAKGYKESAETSATNASTSETNAETSATNASTYATNSSNSATLSQSYAVGGTNTRTGEDTDNAKYYCEQAKAVAKVDVMTPDVMGIGKPDGTTVDVTGGIFGVTSTKAALWDSVSDKVDKVNGKGLSSVDVTTDMTTKWNTVDDKVDAVEGKGLSSTDVTSDMVTKWNNVDNKVDKVDGKGLSETDVTSAMVTKWNTVDDKVDKVSGKGLSTTDVTADMVSKWNGVDTVSANLSTHTSSNINTENGVHGIRFYDDKLAYNNGTEWKEIKTGGGANALLVVNVDTGAVVTLSDGQSKTSVDDKVQFDVTYGTYTITAVKDSEEKVETVTITELKIYTVTITFDTPLDEWLTLGGVTNTYTDINDITETDMRRLMIKHASVDYLATWLNADTSMQDTFIACDYAMKWLGIQDYAYDKITASVSGFETKLLASDNWEYALKDKVPTMTSNTAPYGEAFGSSFIRAGHEYYKAFDEIDGSYDNAWGSKDNTTDKEYIGYKFVNPIIVKTFRVKPMYVTAYNALSLKEYEIQASNNGADWTTLYSEILSNEQVDKTVKIDNNTAYFYYRIYCKSTYYSMYVIEALQFYGRSLNISVPIMTSNTAPYGEVSAINYLSNSSYTYYPWKAFVSDNHTEGYHEIIQNTQNPYIQYEFVSPMVLKAFKFDMRENSGSTNYDNIPYEIQGSNNGSLWETVYSNNTSVATTSAYHYERHNVNNSTPYLYYRLQYKGIGTTGYCGTFGLNFYGVDYSETTDLVPFATGSDQQIARMIEDSYYECLDLTQYWSVGDKRKIYLNAMEANGVSESHHADYYDFVILGFNHDDLTTPINGKTKSAITLQTDRILYKNTTDATYSSNYPASADEGGQMNPTNTNEGGWENCNRRTWCNNIFIGSLPLYIQSSVKKVNKLTSVGSQSSTIKTTSDKVFLPSEIEVFGATTYSFAGEGSQYSYFANATSNRYKKPTYNGNVSAYWWERSPYSSNSTSFCIVIGNGNANNFVASYCFGIAPCICL